MSHTTPALGDRLVYPYPTVAPQPARVVTELSPGGLSALAREVARPTSCVRLRANEHGTWYVVETGSDVLFASAPAEQAHTTPPQLAAELGADEQHATRLADRLASEAEAAARDLLGASVFGADHRAVARVLLRSALAALGDGPAADDDPLDEGWLVTVSYDHGVSSPYVTRKSDVVEVVATLTGASRDRVAELVSEEDAQYGAWLVPLTPGQVADLLAGGGRELVSQLGDALAYVTVAEL